MADNTEAQPACQVLTEFRLPDNFRGRSALTTQLWWLVRDLLFHPSPQFMYGWRRFLLRIFGAKIGRDVLLRQSLNVTYPWKLEVGDYAWIGDNVELYTLGPITIGTHAVVSQGSYLCTGTHDYRERSFPISAHPIVIGPEAWIASQVFVGPGVHIGRGAVVGVRSLVLKDIPDYAVANGSPAKVVGCRLPNTV